MNQKKSTLLIALLEDFLVSMSTQEKDEQVSDDEVNLISEIMELITEKSQLTPEKIKQFKNDDGKLGEIMSLIYQLEAKKSITSSTISESDYDNIYQDVQKYVDNNILTDTISEIDDCIIDLMIKSFERNEQYEKCEVLRKAKQKLEQDTQLF